MTDEPARYPGSLMQVARVLAAHSHEPANMPRHKSQSTPFALIGASAILLSALTLAASPAMARQQPASGSVSWCSLSDNLTSTQRVDGCSAILARKTSITARVAAYVLRGKAYGERREYTT